MAKAFNLTAQINLRGPGNLKPVVAQIRRELGSVSADVKVNVSPGAIKSVDAVTSKLKAMNAVIVQARQNTEALSATFKTLSSSLGNVQSDTSKAATGITKTASSAAGAAKTVKEAGTAMEEFGKQSFLAIKRFAAFSFVTAGIFSLTNAISSGFRAFVNFDKELVKLQQVTGKGAIGIASLEKEITRLATTLGVSSESLINVASTLAQAGLSAEETRIALEALAKTELAPSFDNLTDTTEGAIAAMKQFGLEAGDLESALGSINAVAAAFAVESKDIISAIQRTGGVFATASKGVTEGKDALNEFIAVFTSVRQTTRESAETIATGLRTIFTRIQRASTINQLKEFGVVLTDLDGKFVGPYEAIKRLSEGLSKLDPRDLRFSKIVEELGGFRQIGKVIPLIQQFATAQEALKIAQKGQGSLTEAQIVAQQSLANQLAKVREQFLALIRDVGKSTVFQGLFKVVTGLASAMISLAGAFKPILPILSIMAAVKGVSAVTQFATGFFGGLGKGGGARAAGENAGASASGAKEKERTEATNRASQAITENTSAVITLTTAINSLIPRIDANTSAINNRGSSTLKGGGRVLGFNRGGLVPGYGGGDKVPALLEGGEVVINKNAVRKYGAGNLQAMNRYASGSRVQKFFYGGRSRKKGLGYSAPAPIIVDVNDTKIQASHVGKNFEALYPHEVDRYVAMPIGRGNRSRKFEPDQTRFAGLTASETLKLGLPEIANQNMKRGGRGVIASSLVRWVQKNARLLFTGRGSIPYGALQVSPQSFADSFAGALGSSNITIFDKDLSDAFEVVRNMIDPEYLASRSGKVDLFSRTANSLSRSGSQIRHEGFDIKKISDRFSLGGLIQKLASGGTIEEIAQNKNISIQDAILQQVKDMGGISGVKSLLGASGADRTYDSILRASNVGAGKNIPQAAKILNNALAKMQREGIVQSQAIDKAIKVGVVGLQPFDYSDQDGPLDLGGKSIFMTIRGLSSKFADRVAKMRESIENVVRDFASGIQQTEILGGSEQLRLDFDETLVSGADIFNSAGAIDIAGYSDLDRVKESLSQGRLTELGQKIKEILSLDPSFINRISVLTARPQSNADLLSEKLKQLGLPIPSSKIIGTSGGGKAKADALGQAEKLIDDNLENIRAAKSQGKNALQYAELRKLSDQEKAASGFANIEGATLEATLAALGARGGSIQNRAIDYENGLGPAAQYFPGIGADWPTEVKRTLDGSSLSRAREEFARFYSQELAGGGKISHKVAFEHGVGPSPFASAKTKKLGQEVFDLEKDSGFSSREFNALVYEAKTNDFSLEEFKEFLKQRLAEKKAKANLRMSPIGLLRGITPDKPVASQKQTDLARSLMGDVDAQYNPKYDNALRRASGGTIPARVSNGEAFVSPKLAKKIGYARLDKLNHADKNGASGFSNGGVSVFRGPGSGTSDSISTSLPVGGYVIREKATKALGLYKNGGGVGVRRFADGSPGGVDVGTKGRELQEKKLRLQSKEAQRSTLVEQQDAATTPEEKDKIGQEIAKITKEMVSLTQDISSVEDEFVALGEAIDNNVAAQVDALKRTREATDQLSQARAEQKKAEEAVTEALKNRVRNWDSLDDKTKADAIDQVSRTGQLRDVGGNIQNFGREFQDLQQADLKVGDTENALTQAQNDSNKARADELILNNERQAKFGDIISMTNDKDSRIKELNDDVGSLPASGFIAQAQSQIQEENKRKEELKAKASTASGGEKAILNDQISQSEKRIQELNEAIDGTKQAYLQAEEAVKRQAEAVAAAEGETRIAEENLDKAYQGIVNALRKKIKNFDQLSVEEQAAAVEQVAKTGKVVSKSGKEVGGTELEAARAEYAAAEQQAKVDMPTREADARKALDAAKTRKEQLDPTPPPAPGMPRVNAGIAKENSAYFARRAEKAGMSVGGYKYSLSQQVGEQAYNIRQDAKFAKDEAKDIAVGKSRQLKGLNVKQGEFKQLLSEGATSDEAKVAQAAVAEFATSLQKIAPSMDPKEIKAAAASLAEGLAAGDKSVEELIAGNEELSKVFAYTISEGEALDEAFKRVAESAGISAETIRANVSSKQIKQQEFIKSKEGQRFGSLASFAPGMLERFSKSKLGGALGAGADFTSGKGGALSKAFAGAGGFTGIGMGLATGAETLKQFLPKTMTSDPNTAGALGAVSGAGTGAAAGAQLGSLAGPVGTLIGGIGGAIIGGIQGFFSAKNQAILTNALENIAKKSGDLDIAFKKLETNFTKANFENAQKQFGEVLNAQKDIRDMAFSSPSITGNDAMSIGGMTLAGAGTGAAVGALAGKWIGGLLGGAAGTAAAPGAGTAAGAIGGSVAGAGVGATIGAGIGGLAGATYGFFNRPSSEQRKEALGATIQQAGIQNDTAIRLAESQLKTMGTEDIDKTFKDSNPIVEQYKKGMKGATAAQAEEAAALDAFMKLRKQSGATDEQIRKEIESGRSAAIAKGKEYNNAQAEALKKQALLAIATKQVALATESLLDVYRRVTAKAQRFSDEIEDMLSPNQASIDSLSGKAEVQKVDRRGSERVLGNISAYSADEVKSATQEMVVKLGGGEEAQKLGKQAEAAKFLQDKLPAMLRAPNADPVKIVDDIRSQFKNMGLDSNAIDTMIKDIETKLGQDKEGNLGTLASEIEQGGIGSVSSASQEALKTLQNLSKTYNDTLQKSIDLQNQYNQVIMQANEYMRKAGTIRINAELDLAKALGNSPTLAQLNEPFDFEIKDLTKGLVPGGTTDPAQIAAGIVATTAQNEQLQAANAGLNSNTGTDGQGAADLLAKQQANAAAIGANNIAINEGRQALEKLANDGTKAANALAKIEEQQRQIEGLGNRFEKIFTGSSEELFNMNRNSVALQAANQAGPEWFKSRTNRQDAFAGLEQDKEFLTTEEYRKQRAMLMRKSFESQGYTGQSMINKGGVEMTVDDFLKRIEGGVNEEDPNVKAYREAVATQVKANEELARLNELQALRIQDSMLGLQDFLRSEFPKILTDAVKESKEAESTKPEVGQTASGKKREQTETELKQKRKEKETLDKDIADIDSKIAAEEKKPWMERDPGKLAKLKDAKQSKENQRKDVEFGIKNREDRLAQEKKAEATETAEVKAKEEAKKKEKEATKPPVLSQERQAKQQEIEKLESDIAKDKEAKAATAEAAKPQTTTTQAYTSVKPATYGSTAKPQTAQAARDISQLSKAELQDKVEQLRSQGKKGRGSSEYSQAVNLLQGKKDEEKAAKLAVNKRRALGAALPEYKKMVAEGTMNQEAYDAKQKEYDELKTKAAEQKAAQEAQTAGTSSGLTQNTVAAATGRFYDPRSLTTPVATPPAMITNPPVPVTRPPMVQPTDVGASAASSPVAEQDPLNLLTLNPDSVKSLESFNTLFAQYVDKLAGLWVQPIQHSVEIKMDPIQVQITGAAAMEGLSKEMQRVAEGLIMPKIKEVEAKIKKSIPDYQTSDTTGQKPKS